MSSAGGDVQVAGDPGAAPVKSRADEMEIGYLRAEEIENIRARVLREVEERFLREVGRMTDAACFGGCTMAAQSMEGAGGGITSATHLPQLPPPPPPPPPPPLGSSPSTSRAASMSSSPNCGMRTSLKGLYSDRRGHC